MVAADNFVSYRILPGMITESTYVTLMVYEPEKTSGFMAIYLGFVPRQKDPTAEKYFFLTNTKGDNYLVTAKIPGNGFLDADEEIIINTNDCIKDYCRLITAGILFKNKPQYTRKGLEAVFVDHYQNRYRLIEKRNYTDDR